MEAIPPITPYMIFFRGKLTVNPNTLNNEIHTYFFAHYWQEKHTQQVFDQNKKKSFKKFPGLNQKKSQIIKEKKQLENKIAEQGLNISKNQLEQWRKKLEKLKLAQEQQDVQTQFQYTYKKWMKLIQDVAEFNRFYVHCYSKAFPEQLPINIMDFRAFRLFHDWSVWGDSTSFLQIKATATFDPNRAKPIQNISQKDLYLTTKMGTNKCIMANQDTDNQDVSKLFAVTLNMNEQLKFLVDPFVMRPLHFRTVDTLPWTTSMGCLWSANGKLQLVHDNVKLCDIHPDLQKLLPQKGKPQGWAQMRFLQYRYNHPQKTSSVIGYVMNTAPNKQGKLSYINKYWSIVSCSGKYKNPSPTQTYNNNTNNKTDIQIFLRNVTYDNKGTIQQGVLVDLSAAVMDANDAELFPTLPHYFYLEIYDRKTLFTKACLNLGQVKQLFHINAGMLLIPGIQLTDQSQISIELHQKVYSQQKQGIVQVFINFTGQEEPLNLQIKDRFLKNKEKQLQQIISNPPSVHPFQPVYQIFEKFITFDLYLTKHGQPFTGVKTVELLPAYDKTQSYCNIDPSGLTQYTTNKAYLKTVFPTLQNPLTPQQRINRLINATKDTQFGLKYKSFDQIDQEVFQGKLQKEIVPLTDTYIKKLFNNNSLQYTFNKNKQNNEFKLSFQQGRQIFSKQVNFVNGYAQVQIYLNQNLTIYNNPRYPALESLCLVGKLLIDNASQTFTTIYFQDPNKNPYQDVDWLHVVGPKLKLMGLMYPSMQNIVDLFDYDGLSMSAMKRAFEIEDQNNSRYMPATREMSSVTHRQIRRWLYNPLYDANIYTINFPTPYIYNFPFKDFKEGKQKLVGLLKQAFKIELTTIPLYLSALYSIKNEGQASKLIRSVAKDQMKHLFIVSNLLNAINQTPPYPQPQDKQSEFVPQFPLKTLDKNKGIICFHFQCLPQNQYWSKLMCSIPIQSSIHDQLLRFIMIQMPGQAYLIKIEPIFLFQNKMYSNKIQDNEFIQHFSALDLSTFDNNLGCKLNQTINRIDEIDKAIKAVVLQEQNKKIPKNTLNLRGSIEEDEFLTIGMAYNKILNYFWALNDIDATGLFNGDKRKQFTYMYLKDMVQIINLRTALEQVRQIVEEGQGSSIFSVTGQINTSSHFIKFIQIFTGCDLSIQSYFETEGSIDNKKQIRKGKFIFSPNYKRFPDFPNYSDNVKWTPEVNAKVDKDVNTELQYERLSDNLHKTLFPNTFAPLSFVNSYKKILEELGFIFKAQPDKFKGRTSFEEVRLKTMENTIAKMRQMSLNATHIVAPNDTFDNQNTKYDSSSPKYNISQSSYLPPPKDP